MQSRATTPPLDPKIVLEFLGAAAGVTAFVTLVGGAMMWVRLEGLGLAADRAVAGLPRTLLVTVGAHALVVPALAGIAAIVVMYALGRWSAEVVGVIAGAAALVLTLVVWNGISAIEIEWKALVPVVIGVLVGVGVGIVIGKLCGRYFNTDARKIVLTVVVLVLAVLGSLKSFADMPLLPNLAIVAGVAVVGAVAIVGTQLGTEGRRPVAWVVFITFLLAGAALAIARTANEAKLEPVAVLLKAPQEQLAGFYVGESDGRIHIAQLRRGSGVVEVSAEPVEAIVSVSTSRVTRIALREPAGLGPNDAGREQAERLLEDLIAERRGATGIPPPAPQPVPTEEPWRTFAPLVSLHSGDSSLPLDADDFLAASRLRWVSPVCKDAGIVMGAVRDQWPKLGAGGFAEPKDCRRGRDAYRSHHYTRPFGKRRRPPADQAPLARREGFVLELVNRGIRRRPVERFTGLHGDQRVLEDVPVYYEQHPEAATPDRTDERITYWFFYAYSEPPGASGKASHEGDWERISVLVRRAAPGQWTPVSVRFHEHDAHVDVPWSDARRAPGDDGLLTHPRAYVARDSHATYRRPGRFPQVFDPGGVQVLRVEDEASACPGCPLWFTWNRLVDAEKQPWYGYGGAWGRAGSISDLTGPLGPSRYKTLDDLSPSPETPPGGAVGGQARSIAAGVAAGGELIASPGREGETAPGNP